MHSTATMNCRNFFETYGKHFAGAGPVKVVEIGSQEVNGSLREVCPPAFEHVGVDFVAGKGVDIVLDDPYVLPFESDSADIVISSSCFEHSEMFWVLFLEILRVLKPRGLFYLNVPANGMFHRYPVDCWRFYPDSGSALIAWAKRNGVNAVLLESFVSAQLDNVARWNDFVAVFLKDAALVGEFKERILDSFKDFSNGKVGGMEEILHYSQLTDDHKKLWLIHQIINSQLKVT